MFNTMNRTVQSYVDKVTEARVKSLRNQLGGFVVKLNNLKGRITEEQNKNKELKLRTEQLLSNTNFLRERLDKLQEFLGVEFVEEEVAEYKKIKKTK